MSQLYCRAAPFGGSQAWGLLEEVREGVILLTGWTNRCLHHPSPLLWGTIEIAEGA